jgi:predicted RecB family nuclease
MPISAYVVVPGNNYTPEVHRVADYAAYYRRVRARLEQAVQEPASGLYPEPIAHCEICRWRRHCDERRRRDDHLSLVAGISKSQIGELSKHRIASTAALAAVPLPLPWSPDRGAIRSYETIREQARIQVEGRTQGAGHLRAPAPSCGLRSVSPPAAVGRRYLL